MRKLSSYLISIFLIALFSTSIHAGQEALCDPLKAPGVTKGLYGLCTAYHASGATSQVLLNNYNKKKSPSDPVMPGTEVEPETLKCPCWTEFTNEDIGTNPDALPNSCTLSAAIDFLYYEGEVDSELVTADSAGACAYFNSATGFGLALEGLTAPEITDCRYEILGLALRDFSPEDCDPE